MKSTFLKAVKTIALSLALSLGASGVVLANGAGASPTKVAMNGAGNGAGSSSTTWNKRKYKNKRRVAKRIVKRSKAAKTASHSMH
jgi:hypothetical protein